MKIIKEDLEQFEQPIVEIDIPGEEQKVETSLENNGISSLLIGAINNQWDSIQQFNDIIVNSDDEDIKNIINNVVTSIYANIGQLQAALDKVTPHVEEIAQNEEGAKAEMQESLNLKNTRNFLKRN